MTYELTGKVIGIMDTVQVSDSFRKREFVVEKRENNFTDYVKFQLTQDRCSLADPISPGDEVRISFNIRGNRWERDGRVNYFTNLDAWKIEKISQEEPGVVPPPLAEEDVPMDSGDIDDLPF